MAPPRWAVLERQLLADNVPACREFYEKYFDDRGYLQCFVRWGANDGPDDAFENFNRWPELHALGRRRRNPADVFHRATRACSGNTPRRGRPTCRSPGRACTTRSSSSSPTGCTTAKGCSSSTAWGCRSRRDATYQAARAAIRRLLHGRGSRGAQLRSRRTRSSAACRTAAAGRCCARRRRSTGSAIRSTSSSSTPSTARSTFAQFLAHYEEYTDVAGDHFLNLAATTLPTNAYLLAGEPKYKTWLVDYMDAWLDRMKRNGGVIPSYVDLDGKIGGPEGKWWGNAYGWGFSPVNPVTGRREDRNRIPWAIVGFSNALLVTGDQKYADAWRDDDRRRELPRARRSNGRKQYPDDARRRRLVRLARHAVERRRAGGLVLVAEAAGPGARRAQRLGRFPARAERRVSRAGAASAISRASRSGWTAMRARHDAAGETAGRQHARLQPGGDRVAGAVDVGRR